MPLNCKNGLITLNCRKTNKMGEKYYKYNMCVTCNIMSHLALVFSFVFCNQIAWILVYNFMGFLGKF